MDRALHVIFLAQKTEYTLQKIHDQKVNALPPTLAKKYQEWLLLRKYTGVCVEVSSVAWEELLRANRDSLYSMTMDDSPGVALQLKQLEQRVKECKEDLALHLSQITDDNYIPAKRMTNTAGFHLVLMSQWGKNITDYESARIMKLFGNMLLQHPEALFGPVRSLIGDRQLKSLVNDNGRASPLFTKFMQPLLEHFKYDGENKWQELLFKLASSKGDFPASAGFAATMKKSGSLNGLFKLLSLVATVDIDARDQSFIYKRTALMIAASCGLSQNVDQLISCGADPKLKCLVNDMVPIPLNAFSYAVASCDLDTVKLLLPHSDVAYPESLILACKNFHSPVMELVFDLCCNQGKDRAQLAREIFELGMQDKSGKLITFALSKNVDIDVNVADEDGLPLIRAVNDRSLSAVLALLIAGARVDLKDAHDKTAKDYAVQLQEQDMLYLFELATSQRTLPEQLARFGNVRLLKVCVIEDLVTPFIQRGVVIAAIENRQWPVLDYILEFTSLALVIEIATANRQHAISYKLAFNALKNLEKTIDVVKVNASEIRNRPTLFWQTDELRNVYDGVYELKDLNSCLALIEDALIKGTDVPIADYLLGNILTLLSPPVGCLSYLLKEIMGKEKYNQLIERIRTEENSDDYVSRRGVPRI